MEKQIGSNIIFIDSGGKCLWLIRYIGGSHEVVSNSHIYSYCITQLYKIVSGVYTPLELRINHQMIKKWIVMRKLLVNSL